LRSIANVSQIRKNICNLCYTWRVNTDNQLFIQVLKNHGHSLTKQRRDLFVLLRDEHHMTLASLIERAKMKMDQASVYRALAIFEQLGIVQRINIGGWKYKLELSDKFEAHHHHLTCLQCHKIIGIYGDEVESLVQRVSAMHNFRSVEHQLDIQGYCEECAAAHARGTDTQPGDRAA
jgi:Fur family ferric uptake transcriptional regulator